ncbi:DUF1427 family protein [Streptomyces sp. NPDC015220]|uniref:DUF1427 family protein n=1 Tax=Streptomyces sp. NPDC015220 TaxID=3364947 RepID=UPI0036FBAAB8
MSAPAPGPRRPARAAAVRRAAAVSFAAGLLMGAVYWALGIVSPAPPLLGLTGLLGIVMGERGAAALRTWLRGRRPAPRTGPSATAPSPAREPSTPPPVHETAPDEEPPREEGGNPTGTPSHGGREDED